MDIRIARLLEGCRGADTDGGAVVEIALVVTRSIPGSAATAFGTGTVRFPTELSLRSAECSSWGIPDPQSVWKTVTLSPNAAVVLAEMSGGDAISSVSVMPNSTLSDCLLG